MFLKNISHFNFPTAIIVCNFVITTDFKIHTGLSANLQRHSQFSSAEEHLGLEGTGLFPERVTKNIL